MVKVPSSVPKSIYKTLITAVIHNKIPRLSNYFSRFEQADADLSRKYKRSRPASICSTTNGDKSEAKYLNQSKYFHKFIRVRQAPPVRCHHQGN